MKNNASNLLAELERARDVVKRFKGKVTITAYVPANRDYFRIEYNQHHDRGIFLRYTACEGDTRETVGEVWPSLMYDIFDTPGIVVIIEQKGSKTWFDTSKDPKAMDAMLRLLAGLNKNTEGEDDGKRGKHN